MEIGKRKLVPSLKEIWKQETDFSNWLAKDGLALIAEDIDLQIENPKRECQPGDFRCDIVGNEVGDENHIVLIENQFGKTDHDHLGKILTYAAVHSATNSRVTGIWLAETISDDHRKVIDWLNDNTAPNISLYLARVKAYSIDNSLPAPMLDIVSRPNLQVKLARNSDQAELTASWRKAFWDEILGYIKSKKPDFNVKTASTAHWTPIAIGRNHFWLALLLTPGKHRIGCELAMNPPWKNEAFAQLEKHREEIEAKIGWPLDWQQLPGKKMARILLVKDIDPKDDNKREEVKEWMYENAKSFYETFKEYVSKLKPPGGEAEPDDENMPDMDAE